MTVPATVLPVPVTSSVPAAERERARAGDAAAVLEPERIRGRRVGESERVAIGFHVVGDDAAVDERGGVFGGRD